MEYNEAKDMIKDQFKDYDCFIANLTGEYHCWCVVVQGRKT